MSILQNTLKALEKALDSDKHYVHVNVLLPKDIVKEALVSVGIRQLASHLVGQTLQEGGTVEDATAEIYQSQDNWNNCDPESGQSVLTYSEIMESMERAVRDNVNDEEFCHHCGATLSDDNVTMKRVLVGDNEYEDIAIKHVCPGCGKEILF